MVEIVTQKLAIAWGIQQDVHPTIQEDTFSTLATDGRPTLEEDEAPPQDVQLPLQENIHPTLAEDAQAGRNLALGEAKVYPTLIKDIQLKALLQCTGDHKKDTH